MKRANLYIDGYNFYYSISDNKRIHISNGWCDFRSLAECELLDNDVQLARIKYFTARVEQYGHPGEEREQNLWLDAVQTIRGLEVIYGIYTRPLGKKRQEKVTDVNIAVEMVADGYEDRFDTAILITGDIDLSGAVRAVVGRLRRECEVWIPPLRPYERWNEVARELGIRCRELKPFMLRRHRLPDRIEAGGKVIECLKKWRVPSRPE